MKELNPVQRYNRKLKEKKKLRRTIHKLNKRQDEPYEPRKRHKSPEPEPSNDPMLQELITAHSLRKRDEPDVVEEHIEEPVELPVQKPQTVLLPTSLIHKQMNQTLKEGDDSSSSDSEGEMPSRFAYDLSVPKPATLPNPQSQDYFKKLINRDEKLKDFYKRIGSLGE
mmetsp:Transcript_32684/g.56845  ORF Transcript_32684/g.56845 Transcript_32684/m.56845 type:complete len:168 (+) Transcript_32684:1316-1819(+)